MISILIVEDSSPKVAAIKEVLNEYPEVSSSVNVASDTNNARRLLDSKKYDLLLLDLVLPNDFGDEAKPDNGIDFLNEISLDPNKKRPYHIIGISGFSDFIEHYSEDFKKNLWYLIEYQEDEEDWKDILRNKIEYIIGSKNEINLEIINSFEFDVAIITAIPKELDKVLKLDCKWIEKKLINDDTMYHIGQIKKGDVFIRLVSACSPQMGMCASTALSMKLINNFKPKYLIMCGIAAGIKGEVQLGDILIADQVWDGASGKLRSNEGGVLFQPDPKSKILDEGLKEKLLFIKSKRKYLDNIRSNYSGDAPSTILDIHIGPMASVPAVIQSDIEIEKIKTHSRKLIGIEMETYGVFYSAAHCQKPKPMVFSVKSVSDFANEEKNDSLQDYASYTSSSFVYQMILNELEY
ncbi:response regulator [Algoriphagus sp. NG3]|uniref:5'-methylthioadenosine/S-adenosylhomocysteine nucleosidase family protein n=1 Tax=Algoriphagus sp. NG3 TaxID=3097546 RepID=UPI002A8039D9|nr:response regulator [Algoriphagus sp. NG3]WPR75769.1 response regulator [Algoriphagus sp. NG3]